MLSSNRLSADRTCGFRRLYCSDISVIATPGRFLHLAVEMDLDLRSVEVVIYDEADRWVFTPSQR